MGRPPKHGESFSRLYDIWACMKNRCVNPTHKYFHRYGGRGISVCVDWRNSYEKFRDWALVNGYADDLTIDRIDNNGNYCPENCRWITQKEQGKNRENSRVYQGKGVSEWADELGMKKRTIQGRLDRGWRWEDVVSIPFKGVKRYSSMNRDRLHLPPSMRS